MALEVIADEAAQLIVVLERLDLLQLAEGVEGVVVQIVNVVDVLVGDDDVGEALHVAETVSYSAGSSQQGVGEVDGWTGGRADGRTGGRADRRT